MITVRIDEEYALDLLVKRVERWTDDFETIMLYKAMYENYIDACCWDNGNEFDVTHIVDNDFINFCEVLREDDDEYDAIKAIFDEQGLGDCSCENDTFAYIEAEYNGVFLVRYK